MVSIVNYQEREALQESTRKVKIFFDEENTPWFSHYIERGEVDNCFKKYIFLGTIFGKIKGQSIAIVRYKHFMEAIHTLRAKFR